MDTVAVRPGIRDPAAATISGKTGPNATPTAPKRARDSRGNGTRSAASNSTEATLTIALAARRGSTRFPIFANTARPVASPPQNNVSARLATASGRSSSTRTSQSDTAASEAT